MTQESNKSLCKETTMKTTHKNARQRLEGNKEDAKSNVKEDEQNMLKICKERMKEGFTNKTTVRQATSPTHKHKYFTYVWEPFWRLLK